MHQGRTVLAQLLDHVPRPTFRRINQRYQGDRWVRDFKAWDHYVVMAFAQLTYRESLRDIEACLGAVPERLYHSGIRCGAVPRSTLADANERRDWRFDQLLPEPGSIYVLDRGYVDFERLYRLHQGRATFVIRARKNLRFRRRYSHPVDRDSGLICDQTILLSGRKTRQFYLDPLRRVVYRDAEHERRLTFLTNDFSLPATVVTELYRQRWQVELFFKWIKQHLRIKAFYGTSLNAVSTQIWIAISTYVLVAIVRKRLGIDRELYTLLQILSLTLFEKVPLKQVLSDLDYRIPEEHPPNQLSLFDL